MVAIANIGARRSQATLYAMRERRRALEEPDRGLFVTHRFVAADSGFDVGDRFPVRTRPITFAVTVKRTGAAHGIVFEAGDATTGLAIWIAANNEDVMASVGDAGAGGATVVATNAMPAVGVTRRIVVACIPGSGELRIWIDGELLDSAQSITRPLPNGWSADSAAGIGEVSGTCTSRVPAGDQVNLTGASIVSQLQAFQGQRPRNFFGSPTTIVVASGYRITEAGDQRITEAGDKRITE